MSVTTYAIRIQFTAELPTAIGATFRYITLAELYIGPPTNKQVLRSNHQPHYLRSNAIHTLETLKIESVAFSQPFEAYGQK